MVFCFRYLLTFSRSRVIMRLFNRVSFFGKDTFQDRFLKDMDGWKTKKKFFLKVKMGPNQLSFPTIIHRKHTLCRSVFKLRIPYDQEMIGEWWSIRDIFYHFKFGWKRFKIPLSGNKGVIRNQINIGNLTCVSLERVKTFKFNHFVTEASFCVFHSNFMDRMVFC